MDKSEQINDLAKALCEAQKDYVNTKKASENPFFHSSYADLGSIFNAIRGPLTKNGLSFAQIILPNAEIAIVETVLLHESGQWISSIIELKPTKSDPQGMGSAITYARRYAIGSLVGMATEEDDDGNNASVKSQKPTNKKQCNPELTTTGKADGLEPVDFCDWAEKDAGIECIFHPGSVVKKFANKTTGETKYGHKIEGTQTSYGHKLVE